MEWMNVCKLGLILVLVYLALRFLLPWIFPFFIAVIAVQVIRRWLGICARYLNLKKGAALSLFCFGSAAVILFLGHQLVTKFIWLCQDELPSWGASLYGLLYDCEDLLGLEDGALGSLFQDNLDVLWEQLPVQVAQVAAGCMGVFIVIAVILMSSLLLYRDYDGIVEEIQKQQWYPTVARICDHVSASGVVYLKTQGIIVICVTLINALGLALMGYSDTLFLGFLIGIVDFLPILGAGTVLIPWGLILLTQGSYGAAAGVAVIYLICAVLRQYLEPKLMGQGNGIRPFYMLICIYLGLRLFGIWGVFLGPFGVALVRGIYQEVRS